MTLALRWAADAVALLEMAMERFCLEKRAEARDLFFGVGPATGGDIERFTLDATLFLEDGGGSPSGAAMDTAHVLFKASCPGRAPLPTRRGNPAPTDAPPAGLLRQGLNADAGGAVHRQPSCGGAGEIDGPVSHIRPPVVDRDFDFLAVFEIGHFGLGPQRQTPVGGGELVLIEGRATGGLLPVKSGSVPRRLAHLLAVSRLAGDDRSFGARARRVRDAGGQRQHAHQHDVRETGHPRAREPGLEAAFVAFVQESTSIGWAGAIPRSSLGRGVPPEPLNRESWEDTIPLQAVSSYFSFDLALFYNLSNLYILKLDS